LPVPRIGGRVSPGSPTPGQPGELAYASIQFERAPETHNATVCGLVGCAAKDLPVAIIIVGNKQYWVAVLDNRPRTDGSYIGRIVEGPLCCREIMRVSVQSVHGC
jgi:hypothetical protein